MCGELRGMAHVFTGSLPVRDPVPPGFLNIDTSSLGRLLAVREPIR